MPSFSNRKILNEVAGLGVPRPDQLVVTHGAALATWGIRPEHIDGDIDLVTSVENIGYLEKTLGFMIENRIVGLNQDGVKRVILVWHDVNNRFDVHQWDFSVYLHKKSGTGRIDLERLIANCKQDEATGIWVARPELVLLTKLHSGRAKDADDIAAIKAHLNQGSTEDILTNVL